MSLKTRVRNAVNTAFDKVGDFKQRGELLDKTVSGYNFATRNVSQTVVNTFVDVIFLSSTTPPKRSAELQTSARQHKAIIKSGPNMDAYDTLVVNSVEYRIETYVDNNFVIELSVSELM